jgi:hypothetical protein
MLTTFTSGTSIMEANQNTANINGKGHTANCNKRDADLLRTSLGTPLLLLRDVTAYVTCSSAACVRAII